LREADGISEMIFPFMFDVYPELIEMKEAAESLAHKQDWGPLYNLEQLRNNKVPVYAISFIDDMYVDIGFARETAGLVKGIRVFETNGWYHNAVRAKTDEVVQQLFRLRDDTLD
jgi:hypothetical protein